MPAEERLTPSVNIVNMRPDPVNRVAGVLVYFPQGRYETIKGDD
jgi:hypothetical protein